MSGSNDRRRQGCLRRHQHHPDARSRLRADGDFHHHDHRLGAGHQGQSAEGERHAILAKPQTKAITITADGTMYLDTYPVSLPELENLLRQYKAANPNLPVIVKADSTDCLSERGRRARCGRAAGHHPARAGDPAHRQIERLMADPRKQRRICHDSSAPDSSPSLLIAGFAVVRAHDAGEQDRQAGTPVQIVQIIRPPPPPPDQPPPPPPEKKEEPIPKDEPEPKPDEPQQAGGTAARGGCRRFRGRRRLWPGGAPRRRRPDRWHGERRRSPGIRTGSPMRFAIGWHRCMREVGQGLADVACADGGEGPGQADQAGDHDRQPQGGRMHRLGLASITRMSDPPPPGMPEQSI